ncbi:MAG: hypothetical protein K2Q26_08960 [Bdellovibrionales bacterium]|nr:hypothetical protein [Bdellovibrionales bacterium]
MIGFLGDGILNRIDQKNSFGDVLSQLGPLPDNKSDSWFSLREHALYFMSLFAYMIAYLGFFMAEALTHFVWTVLYVISPLMILAYIPKTTSHVTGNLYRGLIQVILWKVLWTILGVLLLNLAKEAKYTGFEDYLQSIVLNLCIGFSMLFIPLASKSLVNDGFSSVASTISTMPAKALSSYLKAKTKAMIPKNMPGLNRPEPKKNEFRKNWYKKGNF